MTVQEAIEIVKDKTSKSPKSYIDYGEELFIFSIGEAGELIHPVSVDKKTGECKIFRPWVDDKDHRLLSKNGPRAVDL